eukprot:641526-Pelagomonas_calceolata.AAC.2
MHYNYSSFTHALTHALTHTHTHTHLLLAASAAATATVGLASNADTVFPGDEAGPWCSPSAALLPSLGVALPEDGSCALRLLWGCRGAGAAGDALVLRLLPILSLLSSLAGWAMTRS